MTGPGLADHSLVYLFGRLQLLEASVRAAVATRRAGDPAPEDPFRGLYVSDDHVDRLLEGPTPPIPDVVGADDARSAVEARADQAEAEGADLRLRRLQRDFHLFDQDVAILLVALAPDLDARFEKLYGYLNDDVTRRRATIGLALELAGLPIRDGATRGRLARGAPLIDAGLVVVEEPERPFLTRSLRVPDRVTGHLLGHDQPDHTLVGLLDDAAAPTRAVAAVADQLGRAIRAGATVVHMRDKPGAASRATAAAALASAGLGAVVLDLSRLSPDEDLTELAHVAVREARLRRAGLVAGPLEAVSSRGPTATRALADAGSTVGSPVVLISRGTWDPLWSTQVVISAVAPVPPADERAATWRAHLNGSTADGMDPAQVTAHFRLAPEQVGRATEAARRQASMFGDKVGAADLRAGARAQNAAGLEHLARRIEPAVGWNDLVLPKVCMAHLKELAARARNRDKVLDDWRMRPGGGRGRGIAGLFAGDSGTGKTMSAEVIAFELGLDLYTVNLATVVDKYVGETEKNLERIFSEADGVNGVLLFDEADALFGKRSEVRDAHDRYANIEVAYLLQRMETFDGLAILSTNLRSNVDDAFARRLDSIVDFPMPEPPYRMALWDRCLSAGVTRDPDVDLAFLAQAFELSGGNIRSIALTAAYMAAETGGSVSMGDLVRATAREYRKLGRLCVASEFGPFYELVVTAP